MILVAMLGGAFAGAGAYIIAKHLLGKVRNLPDWLIYLTNGVPWATPRSITALGAQHGLQPLYWVSRHDLAECGLVCPRCAALAAEQGDVTNVRRMLINGRENEVVKCLNSIEGEDGSKRACNAILVASPDTEHGDDTTAGDPDDFYRFCRTTAERVLRDRYGMDAAGVDIDGNVTISAKGDPAKAPTEPSLSPIKES